MESVHVVTTEFQMCHLQNEIQMPHVFTMKTDTLQKSHYPPANYHASHF